MKKNLTVKNIVFVILFVGPISCAFTKNLDLFSPFNEPINFQITYRLSHNSSTNSINQIKKIVQPDEQFKLNIEKIIPYDQTFNLTIELEEVKHIYGCVGDYVKHWYQIGDNVYNTWEKTNMKVTLKDRINLTSTSCDCNEKHVDRDDEKMIINIDKLKKGVNRFQVTIEVYEGNGKYAGNTAEYHFHYKITLSD